VSWLAVAAAPKSTYNLVSVYGAFIVIKNLARIAFAFGVLFVEAAHAQPAIAQMQADMIASWLVTVGGENRTRTLRIKSMEQKTPDTYVLEAEYGYSDERQTPVKADVALVDQERKLTLTTQANSVIVAIQGPRGAFEGTFTPRNGGAKTVRITKISDADLKQIMDASQAERLKNAYVPIPCSSSQEQCIAKPDFRVGDRWVYRRINIFNGEELSRYEDKVTEVGDIQIKVDRTTLSAKDGKDIGQVGKVTADRSTWTTPNSRRYDGNYVALAFPLEVGKTWKNEYKWRRSDSGTTNFLSPVKVEGWEEVTVPAGKFRALKVVHSGHYSARNNSYSWSGTTAETFWYAPEIRKFVKYEMIDQPQGDQIRIELTEYEVK
jgi:hypothetical protein